MVADAAPPTRRRHLLLTALTAGCSLALLLGLGEIGLRLYGFGSPVLYVYDDAKLWALAPNHRAQAPSLRVEYRIDSHGYRDEDVAFAKPAQGFRVLVLGDSIVFGQGVAFEQTFSERIQSALSDALPGRVVEAIDTAVPGYNVHQYDVIAAGEGARLDPDLVLIGLCKNDVVDAEDIEILRRLAREKLDYRADLRTRLRRLSAVAHLADGLWLRVAAALGRPAPEALRYESGPREERHWSYTERSLRTIAARSRAGGVPLLVAAFPTRSELDSGAPEVPVERLARAVRSEQQHFVDLRAAFVAEQRPPEALFFDPVHPTALGHAIAAREVLAELERHALLPLPGAGEQRPQ